MTLGGVDLVETFRRLDLVDEYRLYVNPVVVGRGRRLFETADVPTDLELVETRRFGNGVVLLRYAVRRPQDPTPTSSERVEARRGASHGRSRLRDPTDRVLSAGGGRGGGAPAIDRSRPDAQAQVSALRSASPFSTYHWRVSRARTIAPFAQ